MFKIKDSELFGKIVAEEITSIDGNRSLTTGDKIRFINALAKATARVEESGAFMDFDRKADKLLIWSNSNEIYEVNGTKQCQCKAFMNGNVCWHRAAKRLVSRYLLAEQIEADIEYWETHQGCSRQIAEAVVGVSDYTDLLSSLHSV